MARTPKPRKHIYDLYWRFAAERQQTFVRRVEGKPPPWTTDPILRRYKFCNVYRASDRVSQYLIRHVAYPSQPTSAANQVFQILAFRMFSLPLTWNRLKQRLGTTPTLDHLRDGSFGHILDEMKQEPGPLYTSAFILCASDAYGYPYKHQNHVELFKHMFLRDELGDKLLEAKSLEAVYRTLRSYPLMGPFMSYQIAIDLNYSTLFDFDENEFTVAGPGSLRGIRKAFEDTGGLSSDQIIQWMVKRQSAEFERLGIAFKGLWGRQLHAIDCQGLFCELDKYCREAAPELTSQRSRIKSRFEPKDDPFVLFFPPKWQLNEKLPRQAVFGSPAPIVVTAA